MDFDSDGSLGRAMSEAAIRDSAKRAEAQCKELRNRIEALEAVVLMLKDRLDELQPRLS